VLSISVLAACVPEPDRRDAGDATPADAIADAGGLDAAARPEVGVADARSSDTDAAAGDASFGDVGSSMDAAAADAASMDAAASDAAAPDATSMDAAAPDAGAVGDMKIAIPAYVYPGAMWTQMVAGAPVVDTIIANPASGPGRTEDTNYTAAIADVRAAGITVIGYVHTSYGNRRSAAVESDIDDWYDLYDIDGIFFDEVAGISNCESHRTYYADLATHVRGRDPAASVVVNPGAHACESYMTFATAMVTFEGSQASHASYVAQAWTSGYAADRLWLLVPGVDGGELEATVQRAANAGVGVIHTSDEGSCPCWLRLPAYFAAEVMVVGAQ